MLRANCEFCHSAFTHPFFTTQEEEREAFKLHFSFTIEDRYTNLKAYAIALWFNYQGDLKEDRGSRTADKGTDDEGARLLAKLDAEMDRLLVQKRKKLTAKYGEPFPEYAQLIKTLENRELRKAYAPGLRKLEREETVHLICAELEKIIWGEVRAGTASAIKRLGEEIDELVRAAQAEEERHTRELGSSTRELLNRRRAERGLPPLPD